jgi:hypothetical protein
MAEPEIRRAAKKIERRFMSLSYQRSTSIHKP